MQYVRLVASSVVLILARRIVTLLKTVKGVFQASFLKLQIVQIV